MIKDDISCIMTSSLSGIIFNHFSLQEMHLICAHCRPKVRECPECRVPYQGQPRRHRYVVSAVVTNIR